MKILITGADGFIARNLRAALEEVQRGHDRRPDHVLCEDPAEITLLLYSRKNTLEELDALCGDCDFVFHLAGVNRPKDPKEFLEGNRDLTAALPDDVTILDAIGVYRPDVDSSRPAVQEWIAGLDLDI